MPRIIYGESNRNAKVLPPEPQVETKRDALERYLSEALKDLINPIRPTDVDNRINSAFNLIARVHRDLTDALNAEYQRGQKDANAITQDSRPVEHDRNGDELRNRWG